MEEKSVFIVLAHSDNLKVSVDKIKENIFCFCGMHFSDYAACWKIVGSASCNPSSHFSEKLSN